MRALIRSFVAGPEYNQYIFSADGVVTLFVQASDDVVDVIREEAFVVEHSGQHGRHSP